MPVAKTFNVLFLGAGIINFGADYVPWNHSKRVEQKLGDRLNVVGIIDLDVPKAEKIINGKREKNFPGYYHTKVFTSVAAAGENLLGDSAPALAFIGLRPSVHGSSRPGRDIEIQLINTFPNIALFIEKPLSIDTFEEVEKVEAALEAKGTLTSVGYMLRYVTAVKEMKRLIEENNLTIMATSAKYFMAYEPVGTNMSRLPYWDKSVQPGPIVEQATHICDLSRFFAPPVDMSSIQCHTIEHSDKAGHLSKLLIDGDVKPQNKIPRMTNAIWRYENGAMGSLLHGVCVHDGDYSVELTVVADGWILRLSEPYQTRPRLYIRKPGQVEYEMALGEDDCYLHEISTIIDVIEGKADKSAILSTYKDAIESYKLTWAIRWAGEKTFEQRSKAANR